MEYEFLSTSYLRMQERVLPCSGKEEIMYRFENSQGQHNAEEQTKESCPREVCAPSTLSSKGPSTREFEEEVASLLLEFKQQDPSVSPKRKSPPSSPILPSSVFPADEVKEEAGGSPIQKRRKTAFCPERDTFEPQNENVDKTKRRNTQEDSEYEEDEEAPNEGDEDYEDDDDEWYEAYKEFSVTGSPTLASGIASAGRTTRKKAPSGSACEKHKRWKKRCPDDCPMRTSKQARRRSKPKQNAIAQGAGDVKVDSPLLEEPQSPVKDDHGHRGFDDVPSFNSKSDDDAQSSRFQRIGSAIFSSAIEKPSSADYLSLIRWSLTQLSLETNVNLTAEDINEFEVSLMKKINTDARKSSEETANHRTNKVEDQTNLFVANVSPFYSAGTRKSTRSLPEASLLEFEIPKSSPRGSRKKPTVFDSTQVVLDALDQIGAGDRLDSDEAFEIGKSSSGRVIKRNPKFKATKAAASSKGRTGRKYLPQACDRHKMLHAKCPANCPDRIKRDAEVAQQSMLLEEQLNTA